MYDEQDRQSQYDSIGPSVPEFVTQRRLVKIEEDARKMSCGKGAVARKRKKKRCYKGVIAIATIAISSVAITGIAVHQFQNRPAHIVSEVQDLFTEKSEKEEKIKEEYSNVNEELIAQMEQLERDQIQNRDDATEELSQLADETQEEVNASVAKLGTYMLKSISKRGLSCLIDCKVLTDQADGSYFYDFGRFNIEKFICSGLSSYYDFCDVEELYRSLSEEEKMALVLSLCYESVEEYEGTSNRNYFMHYFGSLMEEKTEEETMKMAEEISKKAADKMAKELLSSQLGISLDVDATSITESVGRGR